MRIEAFLIGFAIFSLFIVTGVFLIKDINTSYEGIISENISTSDFNQTYDTIDEMYNISQDQKEAVIGGEISSTDVAESSYKGTLTAVRMVSNTFKLIGNIIQDIANTLHVPSYFIKIALTILTIMIIFGIISIVLRFKQ